MSSRLNQYLPPKPTDYNSAGVQIASGGGLAQRPQLRGGLQKGSLETFDALVAPFVKVTPRHLQKIVERPGLLQHDDKTGRLMVRLDSKEKIKAMHNEVVRNPEVLTRFIKKEGVMKRLGERITSFFRNVGSSIGVSQNETASHLRGDVVTDGGKTKLQVETHKTADGSGNPEGTGEMRLRHKQGVMAGMFRSLWAGSFSPIKLGAWIYFKATSRAVVSSGENESGAAQGSKRTNFEARWQKWKYDHTNDGVYQKRLDQMRDGAYAMALQMARLPTADTNEIDDVFDTYLEVDAEFLKDTNFLGAIEEHVNKRIHDNSTATWKAAVDAARETIDSKLPLSHLQMDREGHLAVLRQIFREIFVMEADADKALKDKQAFEQTDGAVYELGKEYRQAYQDLKTVNDAMVKVGQEVEKSKAAGESVAAQVAMQAAPVQAKLLRVRGEAADKALALANEILDKDGVYARMRQGRALIRGMLPVAMAHDAKALQTFVQNELNEAGFSSQLNRWGLDLFGNYKFSQDATQAIYEGIVRGVSEPLMQALAMNEADAMKLGARKFVTEFEKAVADQQNAVWEKADNTEQAREAIAKGLTGARGLFRSDDKALELQQFERHKHGKIREFIDAKRQAIDTASQEDTLSLSFDVQKTLRQQLNRLEEENNAVEKSTNHVLEVLKPGGLLQQAVVKTEQSMLSNVNHDALRDADLSEATLTKLEADLEDDLAALRVKLDAIGPSLTAGHAEVLNSALSATEYRMRAALADLRVLRTAAVSAATGTDTVALLRARDGVEQLSKKMGGPGENPPSADLLPSEEADVEFKTAVGNLAQKLAQILGQANQQIAAYDSRSREINAPALDAPTKPSPANGPGVYDRVDDVRAAKAAVDAAENERRTITRDCARAARVELKTLAEARGTDLAAEAIRVQRLIVATALGLSLKPEAQPQPNLEALDFWVDFRDESALLDLHKYLHNESDQTPEQRNQRFNDLCGQLRRGNNNNPEDVVRLIKTLFSGVAGLEKALALSRRCVSDADRITLERQTRLAALDPVLERVRGNRGVQLNLQRLAPSADLKSNEGLLAALAIASKAPNDASPELFADRAALESLSAAYQLLKSPPGAGEVETLENEQRFEQLQQIAGKLADMPQDAGAIARYQARLALADLLANVTGDKTAIEQLRAQDSKQLIGKARAAVSIEGLELDGDYRRIGKQMGSLVKRMDAYAEAGSNAKFDSNQPLRWIQQRMSPTDFQRFSEAIENESVAEKMLYYGVLMTYVDGITNNDLGSEKYAKVITNPNDNPLLHLSPVRYSLRRPLDFSAFRQRAWTPEQIAAARDRLGQVKKYLAENTRPADPQVRQLLADRMKFANNISEERQKTIADKILDGSVLSADEKHIVSQTSNIDLIDGALVRASKERVAAFENDMAQAQELATSYRFFDPGTLSFDERREAQYNEIAQDNPFRYGVFRQLSGEKERRIQHLKDRHGMTDQDLESFRKVDEENVNSIIRRLGATPVGEIERGGVEMGLQLFQAMKNLKMARVYAEARRYDAGQFSELAKLRNTYLDKTHKLAREQMLRAGILMAWEESALPFERFAKDPTQIRKVTGLLNEMGFNTLESGRERLILEQLVRQQIEEASQDFTGVTEQWVAEAGSFRSRLRDLHNEFESALGVVLSRLEAAKAEREGVLADEGARARQAVFAMRGQTAVAIDAAKLDLTGTVLTQTQEILRLRMDLLIDQARKAGNSRAADEVRKLKGEIASRVTASKGDTWDAVSDRAASCLRDAMMALEGSAARQPSESDLFNLGGTTGAVLQAVQDALDAEPELQAQAAYNSAAIQFEADFRRDLPDLRRQAALQRHDMGGRSVQLVGAKASDSLPDLFRQGAQWMHGADLSSMALPDATSSAIRRLQEIADESNKKTSTDLRADARALISVLVPLKRVADITQAIEGLPNNDTNRPALSALKKELADALGELNRAATSDAAVNIKQRSPKRGIFSSNAWKPGRDVVEGIRAGLTAMRDNAVSPVMALHEKISTLANNIGQASADDAFDGEAELALADRQRAEDLRNEVLGFEAYVQDVARVFPQHAATCQRLLEDAGGGMALYQIRSALYNALLNADVVGNQGSGAALDGVLAILNRLEQKYATDPASGNVPGAADFGLRVERRIADGRALASVPQPDKPLDRARLLNGNAYFDAIAEQTGEDQAGIRQRVAGEMDKFLDERTKLPEGIASRPTKEQQAALALDGRLHGSAAWGDDLHAPYVARVFKRPVVILGADRALMFEADKPVVALKTGSKLPDNAVLLINEGGNRWLPATKTEVKSAPLPPGQKAAPVRPQQAPQPIPAQQVSQQPVSSSRAGAANAQEAMPRTTFKNLGNTCYLNATLKSMLASMGPSFVSELEAQAKRPPFNSEPRGSHPLESIRQNLINLASAVNDPAQQEAVDRRLERFVRQINDRSLLPVADQAEGDLKKLAKNIDKTEIPLTRAVTDLELATVALKLVKQGGSPTEVLKSLSGESASARGYMTAQKLEEFIKERKASVERRTARHKANLENLDREAKRAGYTSAHEQRQILTTLSAAGKFVGKKGTQQDATEFGSWLRDMMQLAPSTERFSFGKQFTNIWGETRNGPTSRTWVLPLTPKDGSESLQTLMDAERAPSSIDSNPDGGKATEAVVLNANLGALKRFTVSIDGRNAVGNRVKLTSVDFDEIVNVPMVDERDGTTKMVRLRPQEIVFHEGDDKQGHYYAYVRRGDSWFQHDDSKPVAASALPSLETAAQPRTITFEVVSADTMAQPSGLQPPPVPSASGSQARTDAAMKQ
jgi:hypothetical protein